MTADSPRSCPVAAEPAATDGPRLDFGTTTPYEDYVHASVLHSLQRPVTKDPLEMSFLVVTQVMELYFGLITFEWRYAQERLRSDDVPEATAALRRSTVQLSALRAAW